MPEEQPSQEDGLELIQGLLESGRMTRLEFRSSRVPGSQSGAMMVTVVAERRSMAISRVARPQVLASPGLLAELVRTMARVLDQEGSARPGPAPAAGASTGTTSRPRRARTW